jgi:hypothetical protein
VRGGVAQRAPGGFRVLFVSPGAYSFHLVPIRFTLPKRFTCPKRFTLKRLRLCPECFTLSHFGRDAVFRGNGTNYGQKTNRLAVAYLFQHRAAPSNAKYFMLPRTFQGETVRHRSEAS